MTRGKRVVAAILLGWVGWTVANPVMNNAIAFLVGVAVGASVWLLTARKAT